ncbi:MAG TPA: methylamine utilization protein [Methylomirabilota bacterium]|nr:methylamine utilization protein [Methylomirabilota bacterium]
MDGFVKTTDGKPVADAVISVVAVSGSRPAARAGRAIVDQQDKEFVPHVRAIAVGTEVTFPNKDDIRHHVYSFSPAKKFELPLFKGTQSAPVKFDKPGVVVLGCNIHDWMLGYVVVLETPHFDTTGADGRARIADLLPGTYEVHVWHPRLVDGAAPASQRVTSGAGKDERVEFVVNLKPDLRPRRAPSATSGGKYR